MVEDPDGNWGEHEGSWLSIWFGDRDMGWGYGFRCPTTDFINAFEPGDSRLDASVVFDGESIPGIFGGAPHDFYWWKLESSNWVYGSEVFNS